MSSDYSSIYTQLPVKTRLSLTVYGRVRKKFPNMTLPDAIDYALKRYLEWSKDK